MSKKKDLLKLDEIVFSGFNNAKDQERKWNVPVLKLHEKTRISPELKKATKEIQDGYAKHKLAEARLKDLENRKDCDPEKIAAIRKEAKDWEKDFNTKKLMLPMITVHAYFDKGRKDSDPHTFNNLILTDIDHISEEQINELMPKIKKSPYVVFACRSVRGEGIHILNRMEVEGGINDENFKNVFNVTTRLVEYDLNIEADKAVGSISRTMFLNYDEQAYYNPEATPLDINTALWLKKNNINFFNLKEMSEKERLSAYLDAADPNLNWTDGNRHHTLVALVGNCNKAGFTESIVRDECCTRYPQTGFDEKEIGDTVSDVYSRYPSEHGLNEKPKTAPKMDKRTQGHIDTSQEIEEELIDEEDFLKTPCPDIKEAKKYIDEKIYDWVIDPQSGKEIQLTTFLSLLVAKGAMMKNVKCLVTYKEIARTYLYFVVTGAAASGKSCIKTSSFFFGVHAKEVENKSKEEIRQQKKAHEIWDKCQKKCEEGDCGCGAEPIIPQQKDIDLSLNISASKLMSQLVCNGDIPSLIYTSELAAQLDIKEHPLSPLLRMASEGEAMKYDTQIRGNLKIEEPRVAIIGAGTPAQVEGLMKNKEDGFSSRFLIIFLPDSPYKPLDTDDDYDYNVYEAKEKAFKHRAQTFAQYASNVEIIFKLTKKSRQSLDNYFSNVDKRYARFASDELSQFIRRLRKIDIILAEILATSKLYNDQQGSGSYDLPHEIIELLISWNDFFIEQQIRLLSLLPQKHTNKDNYETKYAQLFETLPCHFTFGDACKIAKKILGVSSKSIQRVLKKWTQKGALIHTDKNYKKVDCQEALPRT